MYLTMKMGFNLCFLKEKCDIYPLFNFLPHQKIDLSLSYCRSNISAHPICNSIVDAFSLASTTLKLVFKKT